MNVTPYTTASGRRWMVRYRKPDGSQTKRRGFGTKRAAELWAAANVVSIDDGTWIDPKAGKVTVGQLADTWLESKTKVAPKTKAAYSAAVRHQLAPLRDTPVSTLRPSDVQSWLDGLDCSPKTATNAYQVLGQVLKRAVRDRVIVASPCVDIDLPTPTAKPRRFLTVAQVETLAAATGRPLEVYVLAYCGLRFGELAALRVQDVRGARLAVSRSVSELGGTMVWGSTKSGKAREVPMPAFLALLLAEHVAGRGPDELVFTAPEGGVLRYRNARRWWDKAVAGESSLPDGLTPHELRHTCASLAIRSGANVKVVQRMLGHSSAALTLDRYGHLYDDDLDAAAAALGALRSRECAQNVPTGPFSGGSGGLEMGSDLGAPERI